MNKTNFLFRCIAAVTAAILLLFAADRFDGVPYHMIYNGIVMLGAFIILPCLFTLKAFGACRPADFGIQIFGKQGWLVLILFLILLPGAALAGGNIELHLVHPVTGLFCLAMTAFCEEFFFQGFVQKNLVKQYGKFPALSISASLFCVYHLGYGHFRNVFALANMLLLGILFAMAYSWSRNNLIVAFLINLGCAYGSYLINPVQYRGFTQLSLFSALSTMIAAVGAIVLFRHLPDGHVRHVA